MIKKIMPGVLSVIAALFLQFMPLADAQAGICTLSNSSAIDITINDQIMLSPSTAVPSSPKVLYSRSFPTYGVSFTCDSSTQWESIYSRAYTATSRNYIYNTEIPGIGIRIKWPESYSDAYYVPGTSTACLLNCTIPNDNLKLEFIHIGAVNTGEQIIPAGEIVRAHFLNANGISQFMRVSLGANVTITPRTCAVFPSSNHINLGAYDSATLSASGAGNLIDFNFHISCPVATTVGLMFESLHSTFAPASGEIGVSTGSVPGLSVRAKISTLSASLPPSDLFLESTYSFRYVMERTVPLQAQIFVKDASLFKSQGGAGTVNSSLLYTIYID